MRVRSGVRVVVGIAVAAAAAVVVPVGMASASPSVTTETYSSADGTLVASSTTSFTWDGITYTTDQPTTTYIETQISGAPLSADPSDGVLVLNYDGTPMTSVTIKLANGDPMSVRSFDLDGGGSTGSIELIPDGNTSKETTLPGSFSGTVDLSSNADFAGTTTLELLDAGDSGFFLPTLDNFSYEDLNSPPSLTASGGTTSFVAADNATSTPVAVDSGITVTDGDSSTAASATVSVTGNFHSGEDVLAFTNTSSTTFGNISATYNATTGVLALTSAGATATLAQWQAALRATTYTDTAVTPNTATRTVGFNLNDGLGDAGPSNTVVKSVTVTDTDQTPIVTTTGATTNYVGGTSAVTIDGAITVSDRDNTTQASAMVSVSGGFHSGDTLAFTNDGSTMGNIAASYNAATGVLTLTSSGATATEAQWASALRAVAFSSTSTTYGVRTVAFATSDGTKTSSAATDTVDVLAPLTITTDSGSAAFVAGDNTTSTPVAVDSGLTVTDAASSVLASARVTITGSFQSAQDALAFTNNGSTMGNISGSYNAATGVLTLTSSGATATSAQWQSALQSVTYTDTAVTPNSSTRTVSFTAVDGAANPSNTATRNVTVFATDQTPIVTTTGGTTNYVGNSSAVTIDGGVTVSDLDNTTQPSATVSVTAGFHAGDTLVFTNTSSAFGNIVGSYNAATGVLTLTSSGATATDAQWANALSAAAFDTNSTTYGNRTISFATNDGTKWSSAATDTVDVLGPPTITTDSGSAAFVAGDNTGSAPVAVDSGITVTDAASATLASATVAITGNFQSGEDVLAFTNDGSTMGNVSGSYNAGTGVLTLTSPGATATLAQWQSVLESVKYSDTAITPNNATRTISFTAVDGGGTTSNTATRTATVTDTDQTPILTTTGGATNYVGGTSATTIDRGVTVSDLDNTTQSSATVAITGSFHSGDALTFSNTSSTVFGNVVGSYNPVTGVLTLASSGATATDAYWTNALSAVSFSSTSSTYGNRTISFTTNDGTKSSSAATDTVDVLGPPTITTDSGSAAFVAGDNATSSPVVIDAGVTLTDGSSSTLASATVAINGNFQSGEDVLAFANDGSTMGNVTGSYNAGTGVLTLTSSGAIATIAQWQSALESITFTDTAITPNNATRTISFTAVDGGGTTSNTATRTATVTDTDQTAIVTTTGGTTDYVADTPAVAVDGGVTVSDLDNTTQSSATVAISAGFHSGDTLVFTNTSSAFGNVVGSYNAATGVLTLTSSAATATDAQWATALSAVTFNTSSATYGNRTISFATNDGTKTSSAASDVVDVKAPVVASPPVEPPTYPGTSRIAGADRIATAISASEHEFPGPPSTFTARAVVLVESNDYIDGLTGAPLAAAVRGPLLFTGSNAVPASVLSEIHRLLGSSGTVYLLGGTASISASVETQLQGSGYTPERVAGGDRYATAVAIANLVAGIDGTPSAVFEVSGLGYADALIAAPAAARAAGVVLLTVGGRQSTDTADWIGGHTGIARYAVGGAATAADPGAIAISGADRYATAVDVATRFFSSADTVSLANGLAWPDAAVAAVDGALNGTPLLLVTAADLPGTVTSWFDAKARPLTAVTAYGGPSRISSTVLGSVSTMTGLPLG